MIALSNFNISFMAVNICGNDFVNIRSPPRQSRFVGALDMAAALAAPRAAAPNNHQIDSSVNLLTTGIVSYVAVP
jgi:hypothetical protein